MPVHLLIRSLALLLLALATPVSLPALAQSDAAAPAAPAVPPDPYGRETPRSAVTGLISALAAKDHDRAAHYFDVPGENDPQLHAAAGQLAGRLQALLDRGGTLLPFGALSNEPGGRIDDGLASDVENVGSMPIGGQNAPILLKQRKSGDRQVWLISHDTMRQLITAREEVTVGQAAKADNAYTIGGAPIRDWALLLGLAAFSFGGLWMLAALLLMGLRRLVADPDTSGVYRFLHAALPPLSLLTAVIAFFGWVERMPVAIVARQTLLRYTGLVALVALVWFGLRLVDAISDTAIARMQRQERRQVISVVTLIRRAAKILLLVFSAVAILDTFGIDVTTGIAALGIGGIALALGAQKTVENLVGSVTVIADRPVQVGDFCRVGDVVGTVEDVGIRSTRIRTNERTLVTIPNGDLSSRQIENFAVRDRFLFNPVIGIEYGLSSAKIREAVHIVASTLEDHEKVAPDSRARLGSFGESALNIEVFSYIAVPDFAASVIVREELLLTIYERFEEAGIGIAFPTRTLLITERRSDPPGEDAVPSASERPGPEDQRRPHQDDQ